jgi:hypothetical protein
VSRLPVTALEKQEQIALRRNADLPSEKSPGFCFLQAPSLIPQPWTTMQCNLWAAWLCCLVVCAANGVQLILAQNECYTTNYDANVRRCRFASGVAKGAWCSFQSNPGISHPCCMHAGQAGQHNHQRSCGGPPRRDPGAHHACIWLYVAHGKPWTLCASSTGRCFCPKGVSPIM